MRIIAGKHKGLKLKTFELDNVRPTIDRVRESIFNKIQFDILGCSVLDLFGGTGAFSVEFLSRGASNVVTCDNDANSLNLIRHNFALAKEKPHLIDANYTVALRRLMTKKFDYIFLDPPFESDFGNKAIKTIFENDMLNKNGFVIFEHSIKTNVVVCPKSKLVDEKKYGTIMVSYLGNIDD